MFLSIYLILYVTLCLRSLFSVMSSSREREGSLMLYKDMNILCNGYSRLVKDSRVHIIIWQFSADGFAVWVGTCNEINALNY